LRAVLFFKQIIKRAARIDGAIDSGCAAASRISRLPLDRRSGSEVLTTIPNILLRDPFGDGLRALELGARIEMPAILAGAKIGMAFRTLTFVRDFQGGRNQCTAQGAAQYFLEARHLHPPGPISRYAFGRSRRPFLRRLPRPFTISIGILVAALTVFSF